MKNFMTEVYGGRKKFLTPINETTTGYILGSGYILLDFKRKKPEFYALGKHSEEIISARILDYENRIFASKAMRIDFDGDTEFIRIWKEKKGKEKQLFEKK